jgi:hypothetical protein
MLNIETKSKLKPEEAIKRAIKFFGPEGYGLKQKDEAAPCCVEFEGGGGGVAVTASPEGKGSKVVMESREWDYQVKEFIRQIK